MRHNDESSVEEILDSIKKVIARDNRVGAAELRRSREQRGIPRKDGPNVSPTSAEPEEVLELNTLADNDADTDTGSDSGGGADRTAARNGAEAALINPHAATSMRDSLAALSALAQPGARPQIVRSGETSLEDLVRDLLRPALAQWLDTNLPPLVERLVAEEIARIVGKKG